jgi:predicted dehydrogenase
MNNRTLGIGLIGAGFMGKAHSAAYATMQMHVWPAPAQPKLTCLADENLEAARIGAERFGFASFTSDWRALIARPDVDIVDICTPPNSHLEIALEAIRAGKHVLVEKPLAMNSEEARRMWQAAERAGVKNLVGFSYRRTPAVLYARQLIDEGAIGRIYSFRGHYLQDWCVDPEAPRTWRHVARIAGSGTLGDIGSHIIDIARMMTGDIDSVVSLVRRWVDERPETSTPGANKVPVDVDDEAMFLLKFREGSIGRIEASRFSHGRNNYLGFEINGEKGSITFNYEDMTKLGVFLAEGPIERRGLRVISTGPAHPYGQHLWPIPGLGIGFTETKIIEVCDLFDAIISDRRVRPDFEDGYRVSQIVDAVESSGKLNNWVELDRD